uniref:Complex 1 LYR protein domain-containing protein n=1 Tax=Strombidium rassoulzadegani TaxID=1082188 RepID=A0A7S3FX44_9SPIT|mmetsp:Transcript_2930/g.4974  ORF Transcript_2930/g.4974 Transcript_2930/m.4974 type:complete len:110 (+) Transcript_2930:16-345(+)
MERLEQLTLRQLYRGILQKARTYPSKNREMFRQAIKQDVRQWKTLTDEMEIRKAVKKMRMLYGHLQMWDEKMKEILESDDPNLDKDNIIDNPLPRRDINQRGDDDFVYF